MSKHTGSQVGEFTPPHGTISSLTIGFLTCVVLSIAAYIIATGALSDRAAIALIGVLAAAQCIVQSIAFLHLGTEFRPRWRLAIFWLMITIVFIVVAGSLWIMDNLNYRMMYSPQQLKEYVRENDAL